MNYENKPCPACGAHLHQEDDIVVCPICATPQHRKCWLENGACVNEAKHASGYVWTPDENKPSPEESVNTQENSDTVICSVCGSENPSGLSHCGRCGALLGTAPKQEKDTSSTRCFNCGCENEPGAVTCERCGAPLNMRGSIPNFFNRPDTEFRFEDGSDMLGENSANTVALYLRTSVTKYMNRFRKFENGQKISFNWAAFFLGPIWYFYRKIYKQGIIFILVLAAATLFAASSINEIYTAYSQYTTQVYSGDITEEEADKLLDEYEKTIEEIDKRPVAASLSIMLVIGIAAGFAADRVYYKKILDDLKTIDTQVPDRGMQAMIIRQRGGVSVLNAICAYFIYELTANLFSWAANYLSQYL